MRVARREWRSIRWLGMWQGSTTPSLLGLPFQKQVGDIITCG